MLTLQLHGPSESRRRGIAGLRDVGDVQDSAVVVLYGGHCAGRHAMMAPDVDQNSMCDRRLPYAFGTEGKYTPCC